MICSAATLAAWFYLKGWMVLSTVRRNNIVTIDQIDQVRLVVFCFPLFFFVWLLVSYSVIERRANLTC